MTTPYSPATGTAVAFGATDRGYVENDPSIPWDISLSRNNLQNLDQQTGAWEVARRDRDAALRRSLLPAPTTCIRILTVGDSITVGYGSADNAGYRTWLADLIDQQRIRAIMSTHSHGGWTLADATPGLAAALAAAQPDIVTILLGTNDYIPDANAQAAWQNAYGQAIDQILASSPTVRVACGLVPISQTTSIQGQETRANAAVQAAVQARAGGGRVVVADLRPTTSAPWTQYATDGSAPPPGRWTFDGIHPNDAGYLRMAQAWYATIQPWLLQQ
ncbi:SGNH/GDSL hydrolase family protein [Kitasatospora xanthocidica]|uniref:SGNH/GDSL hydrolase family protein n=1 Tax=Kitasatospora xanthocidica TaxID=83382 RepID=UPI0036E2B74E